MADIASFANIGAGRLPDCKLLLLNACNRLANGTHCPLYIILVIGYLHERIFFLLFSRPVEKEMLRELPKVFLYSVSVEVQLTLVGNELGGTFVWTSQRFEVQYLQTFASVQKQINMAGQ